MSAVDGLAIIPRMMPLMGIFKKYGQMTMSEYAVQFSDPLIRKGLASFASGLADFPALGLLMTLSYLNDRNAGYPMGGSLKFAQAIEKRYQDLGGVIHYKARVEKILVEQDCAVGVRLCDGSEYRADTIVSAADGYATIFKMLEAKYINDEIRGYYKELPIFRPIVQVSMGVNSDFSDQPHMLSLQLKEPIIIAGELRDLLGIKHYCYDPTLAPQGKSVVEVMFACDYGYWKALADEPEKYEAEKKQIALTVMAQIDKVYPGFSEQVEVVDVATPLTYERYTGNWQGSMEGWMLTKRTMAMMTTGKSMSKTLPGLGHFYMIGQWVEPGGGVPTAAISARNAMQLICHEHKRPFVVSLS
jgi:phytoene dehydrogenase-like protein